MVADIQRHAFDENVAGRTIEAAMAAGPDAATEWSRLMAANDPVAALKGSKSERDANGRRYCQIPMWLEPPTPPGARRVGDFRR
jgi:hypothetical protein